MAKHVIAKDDITLYDITWNAIENNYVYGSDILHLLINSIGYMIVNQGHLTQYNAKNGWDKYDHLLQFIIQLAKACSEYFLLKLTIIK